MRIVETMTNRLTDPVGFDLQPIRLSWKVADAASRTQKTARVEIASSPDFSALLYDSGCREDIDSLAFTPDMPISPRTRYYWRVTVVSETGETATSDPAFFETGKMNEPWHARWLSDPDNECFCLTRQIDVKKPLSRARAYSTALGVYEVYVDGHKIGDELLAPYYNACDNWLQAETFDLTDAMKNGGHTVCVMLGGGWAVSRFGLDGGKHVYSDRTMFLMEICLTYEDGTEEWIYTDESWTETDSPVVESSIYDGETYDPGRELQTRPVRIEEKGYDLIRDRLSPPVRVTQRVAPAQIITTPAGETVLDLGQEITGYLEFVSRAPKGTTQKLYYFEILQGGNFYRDNLRSAKEEYTYISDGTARAVRPFHTFFGFRYVKLEGFESPDIADFTGCVVHSDLPILISVTTSNPKVNRFAQNALWGQRGNFLDTPTDCPQRDERLGWTGDAQAFSGTACFQMDCGAFYEKYLFDMLTEQNKREGNVPFVIPAVGMQGAGSCAWADAACVIPWTSYLFYGDKEALSKAYDNMRSWVEWIRRTDESTGGRRLWTVGFHFADWLALDSKNNDVMGGTDPYFIASAYYYYSTSLLVKAARTLGYTRDEARYGQLLTEIFEALKNEYFTPTGRLAQTTQTAYVCALFMGFAPEEHKKRLAALLDKELSDVHGKLRTGFVGTAYLNRVLTHAGLNRRAYELMVNEEYPGWLFEVNMGATTVWERWNSVLPDGSISDTGMNSLNHYAYGAVMEWVYRDAAGLNPVEDAPGFRKALIEPNPHYLLPKISVRYDSAMGWYESSWEIQKNRFIWDVEVPFGAQAELRFPEGDKSALSATHPELTFVVRGGKVACLVPAGRYRFDYRPVRPLHQVFSLDSTPSEILSSPVALSAVTSLFGPQGEQMLKMGAAHGNAPIGRMLTHNPMRTVEPEKVKALEEALLALN